MMTTEFSWHRCAVGMARRSLLSVLVGLMGGGCAVLAQAPEAASVSAVASPMTGTAADTKSDGTASATPTAPVSAEVGAEGKPLAAPGKGKKAKKVKKEKPPKLTPMNIAEGTLTMDGWTGKARMNYDIADLKYVYMWAPGVGTVVVSNVKFPLGKEEPNAFSGNTLTVDASGHTLQLYSEKKLLKVKKPASAWVYVDTSYQVASTYPVMGYGSTTQAPYKWPGAKAVQAAKGSAVPPPLPVSMRPVMAATVPCVPMGSKVVGTPCTAGSAVPAAAVGTTAVASRAPAAQMP